MTEAEKQTVKLRVMLECIKRDTCSLQTLKNVLDILDTMYLNTTNPQELDEFAKKAGFQPRVKPDEVFKDLLKK